jgi:hypothetical protein
MITGLLMLDLMFGFIMIAKHSKDKKPSNICLHGWKL